MAWRMKPGTNDVQIVLRGEAGAFARVLREVATGSAAFTNALDSQHPWSRSLAMLGRDFRETLEKDFPAAFDWVGEKPDWWCRCQGTARRGDGVGGFSPNSEVGKAVRQGQRGGARRLRRFRVLEVWGERTPASMAGLKRPQGRAPSSQLNQSSGSSHSAPTYRC